MDMMGQLYIRHIPREVRAGRVPEAAVDEAVRRVLRTKVDGLFDKPDIDPSHVDAIFPTPESRSAAREVARETLVLLQNRGKYCRSHPPRVPSPSSARLPTRPRDQIGPHRRTRACGRQRVGAQGHSRTAAQIAGMEVRYAAGCDLMCRKTDQRPGAVEAAKAPISSSRCSVSPGTVGRSRLSVPASRSTGTRQRF